MVSAEASELVTLKEAHHEDVPIYERLKRDALMAAVVLVYVLVGLVFFAQVDRA